MLDIKVPDLNTDFYYKYLYDLIESLEKKIKPE